VAKPAATATEDPAHESAERQKAAMDSDAKKATYASPIGSEKSPRSDGAGVEYRKYLYESSWPTAARTASVAFP
jgi:hypothetical protein